MKREKEQVIRAIRLVKIIKAFEREAHGFTTVELARVCAVSPRTIQRDLLDLQAAQLLPLTEEREPVRGAWSVRYRLIAQPIRFHGVAV